MAVILVCLLYASLLLELIFFHVPSVANTQVFFTKNEAIINNYNCYKYVFYWSKTKKIVFFLVPHFLNIILFFVPLLLVFFQNPETNYKLIFTGFLIALVGRLVSFLSMLLIKKNNSQHNNEFFLHTNSIFKFSRNPIQIGMYLFYIGIMIINFNFALLFCFLFYFLYNHFRILIEEDFLSVKFKEQYSQYKLQTRRYF